MGGWLILDGRMKKEPPTRFLTKDIYLFLRNGGDVKKKIKSFRKNNAKKNDFLRQKFLRGGRFWGTLCAWKHHFTP
jgi:hypothetical protein